MSKSRELAGNAGNINAPKSLLINGGFDVWQRGTSQTTSGYGSDDRWNNVSGGSTKVASQQTFALGQTDVAGNPKHYSRTVVTSVAGATNLVLKSQPIEDVTKTSGKTVTLTFWAKADAGKDIALELVQGFGTGGSPSSLVFVTPQTVTLTTSWVKHSLTFVVPSVAGKTLGTNGDDKLNVNFWFEAGSSHDARTNSLGQQSGTFDIARVSVCEGDVTALDDPFEERSIGYEAALCQRYYWRGLPTVDLNYPSYAVGSAMSWVVSFPVTMRVSPATGAFVPSATLVNTGGPSFTSATNSGARLITVSTAVTPNAQLQFVQGNYLFADAEL
jgi:hypothetical protein